MTKTRKNAVLFLLCLCSMPEGSLAFLNSGVVESFRKGLQPRSVSFFPPASRFRFDSAFSTSRDEGCLKLAASTRREFAASSLLLLAASPPGSLDFRKAVELFGSDGDQPAGFVEKFGLQIGKTLDPNFIGKRRPPPVRLPRTLIYKPFAVLLMRSCYDAVDQLNFVPMDKFQKDFFLLRQDEWEKYLEENDCKQGELSDPLYFDFISAAQFATISQKMAPPEAKMIFEERTGAEGTVSVVSRDALLQDDAVLPAAFFKTAGDKMYAGLMANFTGDLFFTQPPQPLPAGASDDEVIASLTILYKKIIELGYALDVTVSEERLDMEAYAKELTLAKSFASNFAAAAPLPSLSTALSATAGRSVTYRLRAPATLWGRQWLGYQDYLHTDHDVMLAQAYLRQCGRAATVHSAVDVNSFSRRFVLI